MKCSVVALLVVCSCGLISAADNNTSTAAVSITDFGAVGDGVADDTSAVQKAADAALATSGSTPAALVIPPGQYLLTSSITVDVGGSQVGFQIRGFGKASRLLWSFDGDCFVIGSEGNGSPKGIDVRDLAIASVSGDKSSSSTALKFPAGVAKSLISNVFLDGQAGNLPGGLASGLVGSGFDLGTVTDTVTVENCVLWFICGTGVKIGRGSEVRVIGGRIIGGAQDYRGYGDDNIGVHVTGDVSMLAASESRPLLRGRPLLLLLLLLLLVLHLRMSTCKTGQSINRTGVCTWSPSM